MERLTKAEFAKRRAIRLAIEDVFDERLRQNEKWGEQNHPDGTGGTGRVELATHFRNRCQERANAGRVTWKDILLEEVYEALAEEDPAKLREELVQVAAVAAAWAEAIDRRQAKEAA